MNNSQRKSTFRNIYKTLLSSTVLIGALIIPSLTKNKPAIANTGIDFMWDPDPSYVRLKYLQTSKEKKG